MKNLFGKLLSLVLCGMLFTGCGSKEIPQDINTNPPIEHIQSEFDKTENTAINDIIKSMSLEEKVWQMFFTRPEDITGMDIVVQAGETTKQALEAYPVGGLIYFSQNIETKEQVESMLKNTQEYSKIPLFISVDEEGGRVARLGSANIGVTHHPSMAEIGATGDPKKAEEIGETLGKELKELGFNVDFAPVADVITVANNEDIGDRSFGTDPNLVADMVAAEVKGMQKNGVSATLKHFPSNGSTDVNTHEKAGVCTRTLEEMRANEFIPFRAGIEAGADMVMVAHMAAINLSNDETPSTLSKIVVTDYLRGELGFDKVVVSDALNMGAITSQYTPDRAALEAVKAGVDLLLMSPDVKTAANAVINAVKNGEISESRINESVYRILELKQEKGML